MTQFIRVTWPIRMCTPRASGAWCAWVCVTWCIHRCIMNDSYVGNVCWLTKTPYLDFFLKIWCSKKFPHTRLQSSRCTHANESCHTYELSHGARTNDSCHTYSHTPGSGGSSCTHTNEKCQTYEVSHDARTNESCHTYSHTPGSGGSRCTHIFLLRMGWLRLVGSLKLYVSFSEYRLFYRALLQKRHVSLRSQLIVATPYRHIHIIHAYISPPYALWDIFQNMVSFIWLFCKRDL